MCLQILTKKNRIIRVGILYTCKCTKMQTRTTWFNIVKLF